MKIISAAWRQKVIAEMDALQQTGGPAVECVTGESIVKKWLICSLAARNIPFVVYALGAGVVRITTDTKTCPCCKQALKGTK